MFHINIIAVGKNKDQWIDDAIAHYLKLLKKFAVIEINYIPDVKNSKNLSRNELINQERILIEKNLKSEFVIALSDRGRSYDSIQFADLLLQTMQQSRGNADFIIGGAYGLSEQFMKKCRMILSLSPMTMSHQLVRPVLLEQLYRGFSILSGSSYHK